MLYLYYIFYYILEHYAILNIIEGRKRPMNRLFETPQLDCAF